MMRILVICFVSSLLVLTASVVCADECGSDSDCKGDRLCYEGVCYSPEMVEALERKDLDRMRDGETTEESDETQGNVLTPVAEPQEQTPAAPVDVPPKPEPDVPAKLGPDQALLVVWLEAEYADTPGVTVYVDDRAVGTAPWEGTVESGLHTIRVEGNGWWSKEIETKIWPGKKRIVEVPLRKEGAYRTGVFVLGVTWDVGFGTTIIDNSNSYTRELGSPSLDVAFRLPTKKLWWEIGLQNRFIALWSDVLLNRTNFISLLFTRFLVPIRGPGIYWTSSIGAGIVWATDEYEDRFGFISKLNTGISFILGDWVEIYLYPIAAELIVKKWGEFDGQIHLHENMIWRYGTTILYSPGFGFLLHF